MNATERRREGFASFPTPSFTFRVLPCEHCGNCMCPCVTEDIELRRARAAVARRHRASVELARLSDRLTARRAA